MFLWIRYAVAVTVRNRSVTNIIAVHFDSFGILISLIHDAHCDQKEILSSIEINNDLVLFRYNAFKRSNDARKIVLINMNISKLGMDSSTVEKSLHTPSLAFHALTSADKYDPVGLHGQAADYVFYGRNIVKLN